MSRPALTLSQTLEPRYPVLVPDATPADAHFAAASQLVHLAASLPGDAQLITLDAVLERVALGLRAVGERRLSAHSEVSRSATATR